MPNEGRHIFKSNILLFPPSIPPEFSLNELERKWVIQSWNTVTFLNCVRYLYKIGACIRSVHNSIECIRTQTVGWNSCMQIYTETFRNDKVKKMNKLLLQLLAALMFSPCCGTKFAKLSAIDGYSLNSVCAVCVCCACCQFHSISFSFFVCCAPAFDAVVVGK